MAYPQSDRKSSARGNHPTNPDLTPIFVNFSHDKVFRHGRFTLGFVAAAIVTIDNLQSTLWSTSLSQVRHRRVCSSESICDLG